MTRTKTPPRILARADGLALLAALTACATPPPGGQSTPRAQAEAKAPAGQSFVGYYSHETKYGEPWLAEGEPVKTGKACLRIEALGGDAYRVELYRVEGTPHICSLVAPARLVGDRLVVGPEEEGDTGLFIKRDGGEVAVTDNNLSSTYCGARASLDGLRFSKDQQRQIDQRGSCTEE